MVKLEKGRVSSGCIELDRILDGGFAEYSANLVRGGPGCGKTILGMHFVAAAKNLKQSALIISFSESEEHTRSYAHRLGIDLSNVHFLDLTPSPEHLVSAETYEIFSPSEVERGPMSKTLVDAINRIQPSRVFIDGFSVFRYLHPDLYQYRRQLIALIRFLRQQQCTALLASEVSDSSTDDELAFASDAVLTLSHQQNLYQLEVEKFRAGKFFAGKHRFYINESGMQLYLDINRFCKPKVYIPSPVKTDVAKLDKLLGGGLYTGSVNLIEGEESSGKTLLASHLCELLAKQLGKVGILLLDETEERYRFRMQQANIAQNLLNDEQRLFLYEADPDEPPEQLVKQLQYFTEAKRCGLLLVDSLNSFCSRKGGRSAEFLWRQVMRYATKRGVLILASWQRSHADTRAPAGMADAILCVENNANSQRRISILRHKYSPIEHDESLHWRITQGGLSFDE